jgi:hypothetical protein
MDKASRTMPKKEGEIRGRKLVPAREKSRLVRPIKFKDLLIAPQDLEIDMKESDKNLRREREENDERLSR